jgi:hypothetical protein
LRRTAGRQVDQQLGKLQRRLVGQPAEHHMAHPAQLMLGGLVELRDRIAVDGTPPRRHRVDNLDQLTAMKQPQPGPASRVDEVAVRAGR